MENQINLTREVEVLHRQFFRTEAPSALIEFYIRCHNELPEMAQASDSEFRTVQIIIKKELDALGIEPWLRNRSPRHLLSRKILLLAFIAECDAMHPEFRMEKRYRVWNLVYLFNSCILAAFHLLRGFLQKSLYGLL